MGNIDKSKERILRVIANKRKNTTLFKLSLPSLWLKQMGVCENDRFLKLKFENNIIVISKAVEADINDEQ